MPVYLWKGKAATGEKRKGKIELASQEAVYTYLKKIRVTPSSGKGGTEGSF